MFGNAPPSVCVVMKDFFGHFRARCLACGSCGEFVSKLARMTFEEYVEAGGQVMACQRRSELTLTCVCGCAADKHEEDRGRSGSPPPVPHDARDFWGHED